MSVFTGPVIRSLASGVGYSALDAVIASQSITIEKVISDKAVIQALSSYFSGNLVGYLPNMLKSQYDTPVSVGLTTTIYDYVKHSSSMENLLKNFMASAGAEFLASKYVV
jgi:hypothetical protein